MGHSLTQEMNRVHKKMISEYNLKKQAASDIAKAKKMENYLRMFKYIGDNYHKDTSKPSFQVGLEEQAMLSIANEVGKRLNLGQKQGNSLFRWTHEMGRKQEQIRQTGADDVFEAELYNLLNIAAEKATGQSVNNSGVEMIGNLSANISAKFMKEFQTQGQQIVNKSSQYSDLIDKPTFRSGKVDVTGYNSSFSISGNIKAQWLDFINTFTGVNMTLKNYSGTSKTEIIHLGKTNPAKAILASLGDLGYSAKTSNHIYYHLTGGQQKYSGNEGHHIIHLRFAYELTGGKLVDQQGHDLTSADFFVYNDPSSSNIWVRSTKAMIAEMSEYVGHVGDPLHSGIVILKSSFL